MEGVFGRVEVWVESYRVVASIVLLKRVEFFLWGGYKIGE